MALHSDYNYGSGLKGDGESSLTRHCIVSFLQCATAIFSNTEVLIIVCK